MLDTLRVWYRWEGESTRNIIWFVYRGETTELKASALTVYLRGLSFKNEQMRVDDIVLPLYGLLQQLASNNVIRGRTL